MKCGELCSTLEKRTIQNVAPCKCIRTNVPGWIMYPNACNSESACIPSRGGCLCGLEGNISETVLTESNFLHCNLTFIEQHFFSLPVVSVKPLSLIFGITIDKPDCFIGKKTRRENPLIAFKLFSLIASKRTGKGLRVA